MLSQIAKSKMSLQAAVLSANEDNEVNVQIDTFAGELLTLQDDNSWKSTSSDQETLTSDQFNDGLAEANDLLTTIVTAAASYD